MNGVCTMTSSGSRGPRFFATEVLRVRHKGIQGLCLLPGSR